MASVPKSPETPLGPSGVGVDFGGTKISAVRLNDGNLEDDRRVRTDGDASVDVQIETICDLVSDLRLRNEDKLGVALAGRISSDGVWNAVNRETLSKVDQVPLRALLCKRLSRDVSVQNDAIAAAVGEFRFGAGRGTRSMAYITVSTGIGGGLILNGQPVVSPSGVAGHIGFTTSRIADQPCGCGRKATVESVAGGRSIAAAAARIGHPGVDAKAVYQAHLSGQGWASDLVRQSAAAVAELCANLKATLDLERVVIGGSIGLADGYLQLVSNALDCEPEIFRPQIVPVELGPHSAMFGVLAD